MKWATGPARSEVMTMPKKPIEPKFTGTSEMPRIRSMKEYPVKITIWASDLDD